MTNFNTYNNSSYRYQLEKGSKKHPCPNCHKRRFVRYVDTQAGEYLPQQYGRCDREVECGYFLNPYKEGYAKAIWEQENGDILSVSKGVTEITKSTPRKKHFFCPKHKSALTYIPVEVLKSTLTGYEKNTFIQNLLSTVPYPFLKDEVTRVIELYRLGTMPGAYMSGAVTFPFIDLNHKIRAIQVKQFDRSNHTAKTSFLHAIIKANYQHKNKPLPQWLEAYLKNESKVSCLFGEHLLHQYPHNPVALVEAPKTAIYGTLYFGFPQQPANLLWLAVYNLSSLNLNKCKALKGRDVSLFPDLSKEGKAFRLWSQKAKEIQQHVQGVHFVVSDLLERLAPEQDRVEGKDLADYLIQQDWRAFRQKPQADIPQPSPKHKQPELRTQSTEYKPKPLSMIHIDDDDPNFFKQLKEELSQAKNSRVEHIKPPPTFEDKMSDSEFELLMSDLTTNKHKPQYTYWLTKGAHRFTTKQWKTIKEIDLESLKAKNYS